jgi:hypothetical protein
LAQNPNHLLGLAAAASAALASGDDTAARGYYQRIIDAYPAERSKQLTEYMDHGRVLPEIEAEARRFLAR